MLWSAVNLSFMFRDSKKFCKYSYRVMFNPIFGQRNPQKLYSHLMQPVLKLDVMEMSNFAEIFGLALSQPF